MMYHTRSSINKGGLKMSQAFNIQSHHFIFWPFGFFIYLYTFTTPYFLTLSQRQTNTYIITARIGYLNEESVHYIFLQCPTTLNFPLEILVVVTSLTFPDFFSGRRQHLKLTNMFLTPRPSTLDPPKLHSSPLLPPYWQLHPYSPVKLLKFGDDTTIICLTSGGVESPDRRVIDPLVTWWRWLWTTGIALPHQHTNLHHPVGVPHWHRWVLLLPRHHHYPGPHWMGYKNQLNRLKRSAKNILPMEAEYIQPAQEDDGALLHWQHWVHPQLPITIWYAAATPLDEGRLRRLSVAICHPSRACETPTLDTNSLRHSSLAEGCCLSGRKALRHKNGFFPSDTGF